MCRSRAYEKLKERYENLEADLSVLEFHQENKAYCTRHGITLRALQNRIAKEKWQSKFEKNAKIVEKTKEITEEIIKEVKKETKEKYTEIIDRITQKALMKLEQQLDSETIKDNDLTGVIKSALDISGLKKEDKNLNINPKNYLNLEL